MDTWVLQMVRARCIRRMAAWALALGCVVLFAIAQHRYISNCLMGPFDLDQAELDSIGDIAAAPHYFARVTGSKAIDTGIEQVTLRKRGGVETSRSVSSTYYALVVGNRLLVVKSSAGALTTAEGELRVIREDLDRQLFNTPAMQAIRDRFYPFYLDDASFRFPGYCAIVATLLFGFFLVIFTVPTWRQLQKPSSHPVVRRVASWGDPFATARDIEREASTPHYKGSSWLVTENYLIQSRFFTFDILRLSDLLWAYKRITKHKFTINFIPMGKTYETYEVVLVCYGGIAVVNGLEGAADTVLAFAAGCAPWAVLGFSSDLQTFFNKRNQDFCAAVEQRRRQWVQ
jgi:hypothetical protein